MFGWSMLFHTYPSIGTAWYPAHHSRRRLLPVGSVVFAHADRHVGVVSERQYWRALTGTHGYSQVARAAVGRRLESNPRRHARCESRSLVGMRRVRLHERRWCVGIACARCALLRSNGECGSACRRQTCRVCEPISETTRSPSTRRSTYSSESVPLTALYLRSPYTCALPRRQADVVKYPWGFARMAFAALHQRAQQALVWWSSAAMYSAAMYSAGDSCAL